MTAIEAVGPDGAAARRLGHGEGLGEGTRPSGNPERGQISASLPIYRRSLGQVGRCLGCYSATGFVATGQTQSPAFDEVTGRKPGKEALFWSRPLALIFDTWEVSGPACLQHNVYPVSPAPSCLMTSRSGVGLPAQSNLEETAPGWGKVSSSS